MSKRALTALLAFVAVAVFVGTIVVTRETTPSLTREELLTYQDAIHPLMSDGGRTVEQGMKPGVPDVRAGKVATSEAEGWVTALQAVREQVVAVEAPPALRDAARLFREALDSYVDAADALRRATGDADRRETLVDFAVTTAESADRTYDEASLILQNWRRRLGLGSTAEFPDPTPAP